MSAPSIGALSSWRSQRGTLDRSHPLASRLAFLWDPADNKDLVTGRALVNRVPLTWSPWGPAASFTGSTPTPQFPLAVASTDATVITLMYPLQTNTRIIVELTANAFGNPPAFLQYQDGVNLLYQATDNIATTFTFTNRWVGFGTTHSNATAGKAVTSAGFKTDGSLHATPGTGTSASGTGTAWTSDTLNIGARNASSLPFVGTIATVAIWGRMLTLAEMSTFVAAPWQVVR